MATVITSAPCTILLRINGDFENICDAAVIENGSHLFYEKPVESIVVLEEASHKVLYMMSKELPKSSPPEQTNANQNPFFGGSIRLSDKTSPKCARTKVNGISNLNIEKQPTKNIKDCTLSNQYNSTRNGVIDRVHGKLDDTYHDDVQTLQGDKIHSVEDIETRNGRLKLDFHSTRKLSKARQSRDDVSNDGDQFYQITTSSCLPLTAESICIPNTSTCKPIFCGENGINQFSTQLDSTMVAEVHTTGDAQNIREKKFGGLERTNCVEEESLHNKMCRLDNKSILDNKNGITTCNKDSSSSNEQLSQPNNCVSVSANEKQVKEIPPQSNIRSQDDQVIDTCFKEMSTSNKWRKMPSTISMASLTSSLDSSSNCWSRPLRRRSTLSTIISTASSASNNGTSNLNKLPLENNKSSSILPLQSKLSSTNTDKHYQKLASGDDNNSRSNKIISNETETKSNEDKVRSIFHKSTFKTKEMDIEEKILQRREMAHLFKWYYPEGGWGWVVLCAAMFSQAICHGVFQLGFSYPLGIIIRKRFSASEENQNVQIIDEPDPTAFTMNSDIIGLNGKRLLEHIPSHNTTTTSLHKGVYAKPESQITTLQIGK